MSRHRFVKRNIILFVNLKVLYSSIAVRRIDFIKYLYFLKVESLFNVNVERQLELF